MIRGATPEPVEQVLVLPRKELFPDDTPQGFVPGGRPYVERIRARAFFTDRPGAEEDPSLKQVIPYALICRGRQLFVFRRSSKGGDRRLHGRRSVGVGGHINPVDGEVDRVLCGLRRELEEEVGLGEAAAGVRWAGILNDDATAVGRVHVGVVGVVDAGVRDVIVREPDRMSGSFLDLDEVARLLRRERATFEGWSLHLLDRLDEVLPWPALDGSSSTARRTTPTSTT